MNSVTELTVIFIEHRVLKIKIVVKSENNHEKQTDRKIEFEIKMLSLILDDVAPDLLHQKNLTKDMCLIVLGRNIHPKYRLILVANRDEFYERPTQAAHYWDTPHQMLAGKDLQAGGTWLGVNSLGNLAAVTNYRDPVSFRPDKSSRGKIPVDFLINDTGLKEYLNTLRKDAHQFNGFNLLAQENGQLIHYNNQEDSITEITDGVHAISNATLNTPWPKVIRAKERFKALIKRNFDHEALIEMMGDTETADPKELPDTGIPHELEVAVSAMCIRTEKYGTCSTTAITITHDGQVNFTEKSYPVGKRTGGTVRYNYKAAL